MTFYHQDTITAIATAAGRGGVGIVRISGPQALPIAEAIIGFTPKNRFAHYCDFYDYDKTRLDQGIVLYFNNPHSFTGEDVVELQAHGGPVVLDLLLKTIIQHGGRLAEPGEFSQRAFFNDKLDLVQAEAISDLINSTSEQAARCALRSLQGEFSNQINNILDQLIKLRIFVEAAIDFPEEEVDFLTESNVLSQVDTLIKTLNLLFKNASQGALLTEGMRVVIAGKPNAGKSSLLNALAGKDSAIVTNIEGTTRDILREHIHIDGMPLHIIDTAGLRDSPDEVERIGIERAWEAIEAADRVLLMVDSQQDQNFDPDTLWPDFIERLPDRTRLTVIANKSDLSGIDTGLIKQSPCVIAISAETGAGIDTLRQHLKDIMGFTGAGEGGFTARRRHLDAISRAQEALVNGTEQLLSHAAGELLAEDLRQAQMALSEITGEFTPDELLGRIFSSFCIGK